MANPVEYRLRTLAVAVLIFAATVVDAITLIPSAGDFIGPAYWVIVSIFLYTKGFGILNARRFATSAISMVAELIPIVQEFPMILAGTIVVIVLSRIEDKTGIKVPMSKGQLADKTEAGATPRRGPLNQGGVRQPQPEPDENETGEKTPRQPLNVDGVRQPAKDDSWMYDKKASEYAKDQNEKFEIAKRMGYSSDESATMAHKSANEKAERASATDRQGY